MGRIRRARSWPGGGLALAVCAGWLAAGASGVRLAVLGGHTECVTETATEPGDLISGGFVAVEKGGLLEGQVTYDMEVKGPSGRTAYTLKRKAEFKFEFHVDEPGKHALCFHNNGRKEGELLYHAHVGHHVDHKLAVQEQMDPIHEAITNLKEDIAQVREQQIFALEQDEAHRATNVSTNKRVLVFSVLESCALVGIGLFQVVFVRRLFERKDQGRGV